MPVVLHAHLSFPSLSPCHGTDLSLNLPSLGGHLCFSPIPIIYFHVVCLYKLLSRWLLVHSIKLHLWTQSHHSTQSIRNWIIKVTIPQKPNYCITDTWIQKTHTRSMKSEKVNSWHQHLTSSSIWWVVS